MWQTPESMISPLNSTPASSNFRFAVSTSATRMAIAAPGSGWKSPPIPLEPERLAVELRGPLTITNRHSDEVDALGFDRHRLLSVWSRSLIADARAGEARTC
jgi:hypothetical protein